jgi:hypothetical protein
MSFPCGSGSMTTDQGHNSKPIMPMTGSGSCGSMGNNPTVSIGSGSNPYPETNGSCGSSYAYRQVYLSSSTCHNVTVNYYTKDDTAKAGTDYVGVGSGSGIGTLTIPAGQIYATQPIKIAILDDGNDEGVGSEDFYVNLTNPQGATLGNSQSKVIIAEQVQGATDTLVWNPCRDGDDYDDNNEASDPTNWYDQTIGQQLEAGQPGPGPSTPVILDGTPNSQTPNDSLPIIWDRNFTIASMTLQEGYTAQQTVYGGNTIEMDAADGFAFAEDANSNFKVILGANSKVTYDGAATLENFNIQGSATSLVLINSGTTTMAGSPGFTENLGAPLTINNGATLNYQSYNTLNLTLSNLVITVKGEMDAYWGTGNGITLIQQDNQVTSDYIDVTGGTLYYKGKASVEDTIAVPILVENSGNFTVTSSSGGWLIVKGQVAQTQKYSVYMTSGSVNLSQATTLECDDDYRQDAGTLQTTDSSNCGLQDGPTNALSTAVIQGGALNINGGASSGILNVYAGNLDFAGTFKVGIQGNQSGQQGQLIVSGNMNLQAGNVLSVSVNGQLNNGNWTIITTGGNNIADFTNSINPAGGLALTGHNNKPQPGQYQVTSP